MEFVFGSLAGTLAGICTNPLEVVKTRMQLQGELEIPGRPRMYKNTIQATYIIARNEGVLALQKGLGAFVGWQILANGTRLGSYATIRDTGFLNDSAGQLILHRTIFIGALTGGISGYIASPFLMIKTQMQAESGPKHLYSNVVDALVKIYKREGIKGWYRGSVTCIKRTAVGSSAQLSSFQYVKDYLTRKDLLQNSPIWSSFIASMSGGVVISVAMSPFDLVLTRLYHQGKERN